MSSDYDDLPPERHTQADEDSAGGALGTMVGAALWIVPIFAVGGLIAYLLIHALR